MSLIAPNIVQKLNHESIENSKTVSLISTREIALMKKEIFDVCEQLETITLYQIYNISKILDEISIYIPEVYNSGKFSYKLLKLN